MLAIYNNIRSCFESKILLRVFFELFSHSCKPMLTNMGFIVMFDSYLINSLAFIYLERLSTLSVIFRPPGTVVPDGLVFYRRCFFFFRQPNLQGPSADRRETLPHDRNLAAVAG